MKGKILLLVFVTGLAAALPVSSTQALFADTEVAENTFTVGAVDLRIGWNNTREGSSEIQPLTDSPGNIFNETGIQRGEHGTATIELLNTDNPAYLRFRANQTGNDENGEVVGERGSTCSSILGVEDDDFQVYRDGEIVLYTVKELDGSYIELKADGDNELGENGREGTDRFVFELDGSVEQVKLEIESRSRMEYLEIEVGEERELFEGDMNITFASLREKENGNFEVVLEVESDSSDNTPGLDVLAAEFCGQLTYYQADFVRGDVIEELGEDGFYGSRMIQAVHSTTLRRVGGRSLSDGCVTSENGIEGLRNLQVHFTVEESCSENLTLAVYEKPSDGGFVVEEADEQVLLDFESGNFGPGDHTLSVEIPAPDNSTGTSGSSNASHEGELGDWLNFVIWHDDGDGQLEANESLIFNGTAHELGTSVIGEGLLLDANPQTFEIDALPGETSKYLGFKWLLPEDASCQVQTDSKTFNFEFASKQERHNEDTLIDTQMLLGDIELSSDNYFQAGTFDSCTGTGICGPILGLEEGSKYVADRVEGHGFEEYYVERPTHTSVKFESSSEGLGEDGRVEADRFNVTVNGDSNETVWTYLKAGRYSTEVKLQGEGDSQIDSSGNWNVTLVEVNANATSTTYTIEVRSDEEEGRESPALSHVVFVFCEEDDSVANPGNSGNKPGNGRNNPGNGRS